MYVNYKSALMYLLIHLTTDINGSQTLVHISGIPILVYKNLTVSMDQLLSVNHHLVIQIHIYMTLI